MGTAATPKFGINLAIVAILLLVVVGGATDNLSPTSAGHPSAAGGGSTGVRQMRGQLVDTTTPASLTVRVIPATGSNRSGAVTIQALPVNAVAVSQIYFYIGNTFEGSDLSAPYCVGGDLNGACKPFDAGTLPPGSHTVKAYMSFKKGTLTSEAVLTVPAKSSSSSPTTTLPATTTTGPTSTAPTSGTSAAFTPFAGLNVYELASDPGANLGCGASFSGKWSSFFSSLPAGTVLRFWATQQMATSATNSRVLNWSALDSVFDTAAKYHIHLIPVLANEWTNCDGARAVQKQLSWFQGGYTSNTDEGSLPYLAWLRAIVSRYTKSPATYWWEPINEAQATNANGSCSESPAARALRSFYDTVGGTIHSIDPTHKVESGLEGEGNCGTADGDYSYVGGSPGIDILAYHDYYPAAQAEGGDRWNGIAVRIAQAAALHKPIFAGEDGIIAGTGCGETLNQRAGAFLAQAKAQFAAGTVGMLLWNWEEAPTNCTYDIGPGDPSLALLHTHFA
jgi:hypothetical protein